MPMIEFTHIKAVVSGCSFKGWKMSKYFDEVVRGTEYWLDNPKTLFIGQSTAYVGNVLFNTLNKANVPMARRLEVPVFEEVQMGMSTGLALGGIIPISMYPRFDFLLCAMNQLVTHLDKFPDMSQGEICPKVIIKVLIGSIKPLHPGHQHCGDYTESVSGMLKNVEVINLKHADEVFSVYERAVDRTDGKSTLIVEASDLYKD